MMLKRRDVIVPLSVVFLGISVLLQRFAAGSAWGGFLEGVFMGMSLTLGVFAIIMGALVKSDE